VYVVLVCRAFSENVPSLEDFKRKIKHLAKLCGDSVLTSFRELVSTWYTLASRIDGIVKLQF
jgi:hypothetical protein